jgi:hypothetical protein
MPTQRLYVNVSAQSPSRGEDNIPVCIIVLLIIDFEARGTTSFAKDASGAIAVIDLLVE